MLVQQHQQQQPLGEKGQPVLGHLKVSHRKLKAVEKVIIYLASIRTCATEAELSVEDEFYTSHDFLYHSISIEPPSESSWLKPNGSFVGIQRFISAACLNVPNPGPTRPGTTWSAKVVIHSVDNARMALTGTIESSDVPDMPLPSHESCITTFLEGEIIDFNLHTLETKNFGATARVDGTYWRKLEPFNQLSDEKLVKNLLSKSWINKVLMKHWVLMRWKETCHVKPSNASSTIDGFYYVSIRRCDGHIEGLYYDPSCPPYQYLSLVSNAVQTFPAYCFT